MYRLPTQCTAVYSQGHMPFKNGPCTVYKTGLYNNCAALVSGKQYSQGTKMYMYCTEMTWS